MARWRLPKSNLEKGLEAALERDRIDRDRLRQELEGSRHDGDVFRKIAAQIGRGEFIKAQSERELMLDLATLEGRVAELEERYADG